jgi:hypothetical protein
MMIRKILFCAALGSLLLVGVPSYGHNKSSQNQSGNQTQQATKTVLGKVASIGDHGKSFVLEVDNGNGPKQNMQFVLDKNTQVEGHVTTGTMVLVEYQSQSGDQNVCVKISARQG